MYEKWIIFQQIPGKCSPFFSFENCPKSMTSMVKHVLFDTLPLFTF